MTTQHAVFIGPISHLRGKFALIRPHEWNERVYAQFDDTTLTLENVPCRNPTQLGYGWWTFRRTDFAIPLEEEDPMSGGG